MNETQTDTPNDAANTGHTTLPQRLIAWITGAFALLLVAVAAVSALTYAVLHHSETLSNLATSTLSGVGIAVGGCLGSALILRFKVARRFIKKLHPRDQREDRRNQLAAGPTEQTMNCRLLILWFICVAAIVAVACLAPLFRAELDFRPSTYSHDARGERVWQRTPIPNPRATGLLPPLERQP